MNPAACAAARSDAAAALAAASLEAADDSGPARRAPRYCPTELLASFALLMAGHGRCVNTDMMLGDREYAMWQLACARAMDDAELRRRWPAACSPTSTIRSTPAMPVMGTA